MTQNNHLLSRGARLVTGYHIAHRARTTTGCIAIMQNYDGTSEHPKMKVNYRIYRKTHVRHPDRNNASPPPLFPPRSCQYSTLCCVTTINNDRTSGNEVRIPDMPMQDNIDLELASATVLLCPRMRRYLKTKNPFSGMLQHL